MKTLRVLFITPASHRSGAPILMLHLIQFLRKQAGFELSGVLAIGGMMEGAFQAEMPTQTFEEFYPTRLKRWLRRVPGYATAERSALIKRCRKLVDCWPPDIVYCNSAASAGVLDALGPYSCPVVMNLHELEHVLHSITWVPGGVIAPMLRHTTHYVAGSHAVQRSLMARHAVPSERITVVHDFISAGDFDAALRARRSPDAALLARHKIPAEAVVVGAIGTVEWRKGADLFAALACLLPPIDAMGRPIHFVWVGGGTAADMMQLNFDVETASLGNRVHVVGPTNRTADWYPAFAAFALLSREDPFPLVALEAAASGVPIVCFASGGGMPEFVEADAGFVVPFLDLPAFADALQRLINDPALCARLGQTATAKVRARHDVGIAVPQIMQLLRNLAAGEMGAPTGSLPGHIDRPC